MKYFLGQQAMTLVELVVSVTITGIILVIVTVFITDGVTEVSETVSHTELTNDVFLLRNTLNNITRSWYSNFEILQDSNEGSGLDIVMLTNPARSEWYIVGIVSSDTLSLVADSDYNIYSNRSIGYRSLSWEEITAIDADVMEVFDYNFFYDKLFPNLTTKDFQVVLYNGDQILDVTIVALKSYYDSNKWQAWSIIDTEDFIDFNLIF